MHTPWLAPERDRSRSCRGVSLVSWMFDVVQWDEGDRRVALLPDVPDALSCNYFVYCLAVLRTQTRDQEGRHVILVARLSGKGCVELYKNI